jgi:DnaJ-class molecular chaperone
MSSHDLEKKMEDCPECRGTGKISSENCDSCGGEGQIIIHSHTHSHGEHNHDHPHPHGEPHRPGDDTKHDHGHEPA